jgi:hypothetical protein
MLWRGGLGLGRDDFQGARRAATGKSHPRSHQAVGAVRANDGLLATNDGPKRYFSEFSAWAGRERRAMRFARGSRALDVGSGAGRVSLYLQRKGESLNPDQTRLSAHLRYQRRNRQRGRMGGQIRIRVRFREIKGPWFDYLLVSPAEMKAILSGTGWRLRTILRDAGPVYVAVIGKAGA